MAFLLAKDVPARSDWLALFVLFAVAPLGWAALLRLLGVTNAPARWPGADGTVKSPARIAVLVTLAVLLGALPMVGRQHAIDSARYLDYGTRMWDGRLDFATFDIYAVMYLIPNAIIGGAQMIPGLTNGLAVVLINIAFFTAVVLCCFEIWQTQPSRMRIGQLIVVLVLLLGCSDVVMWNYYVLSDVNFLLFVAGFWVTVVAALHAHHPHYWGALAVAAVSTVARPTGLLHLGFWVIVRGWVRLVGHSYSAALACVIVPFLIAELAWPYVLYLKSLDVGWASMFVSDELMGWYREGAVVCYRLETYLDPPRSYTDYVRITLYKLFYFYFPFRGGYSFRHNALVAVYFPLLLSMAHAGWGRLRAAGPADAQLAQLLGLFILYSGLFHSMLYVDYDWRYQLPAMLAAWLLAGFALIERGAGKARTVNGWIAGGLLQR